MQRRGPQVVEHRQPSNQDSYEGAEMAGQIIGFPQAAQFTAAISDEEMFRMERGASSQDRGVQRRCVLTAVARDQQTLMRLAVHEPEAYAEFATGVREFRNHAKALLEVAEAASARLDILETNLPANGCCNCGESASVTRIESVANKHGLNASALNDIARRDL
jgi:hypothetical protein